MDGMMKCIAQILLGFVLVLEAFDDSRLVGRTIVFGFESQEGCEARLEQLLKSDDEDWQYRGACMPQEKLNEYLGGVHHST